MNTLQTGPAIGSHIETGKTLTIHASDERLARLAERMATVYEGFGHYSREQIEAATWAWLNGAVETLLTKGAEKDFGWELFDAALIGQANGGQA